MKTFSLISPFILLLMSVSCSRGPAKEEPVVLGDNLPFVVMHSNLYQAKEILLEEFSIDEKKKAKADKVLALFDKYKPEDTWMLMYPNKEHMMMPVIMSKLSLVTLAKIVSEEGLSEFLKDEGEGTFTLQHLSKSELVLPDEPYEIKLLGGYLTMAPKVLFDVWEQGSTHPLDSPLCGRVKYLDDSRNLFSMAIGFPEKMTRPIDEEMKELLKDQKGIGRMIGGAIGAFAKQFVEPFQAIDSFAVAFKSGDSGSRTLSYTQNFRDESRASAVANDLESGSYDNMDLDNIVLNLIELFEEDFVQQKVASVNNKLVLHLDWKKEHDEAFGGGLGKATIGYLISQAMGGNMEPSKDSVTTTYRNDPELVNSLDKAGLDEVVRSSIKKVLFPGHYWKEGKEPHMTLEVDRPSLPNAFLAEITYEILSIDTASGENRYRKPEAFYGNSLQLNSSYMGNIRLPVKEGTLAEQLSKSKILFKTKIPTQLSILEFSKNDKPGKTVKSGKVKATLKKLEGDVASVNVRGAKALNVIAYDQSGRALDSGNGHKGSTSASYRYKGLIDHIKVVAVTEFYEKDIELVVDLNNGTELEPPKEAADNVITRYDYSEIKEYKNIPSGGMDGLKIDWIDASGNVWRDSLQIKPSFSQIEGRCNWSVHFFGKDKAIELKGSSYLSDGSFQYAVDKGALANVHAITGKVKLEIKDQFQRLKFSNTGNGKEQEQTLQNGKVVRVMFDRNELKFNTDGLSNLQLIGFSDTGKQLKKVNWSSSSNKWRMKYFWGNPSEVWMDFSLNTVEKLMPIDIVKREVDQSAFKTFKQGLELEALIGDSLKRTAKALQKSWYKVGYGDSLSGLYFLQDKKGQGFRIIDEMIALSDPVGQEAFGYKAKPYKGYSFKFFKGTTKGGEPVPYVRGNRERTWKSLKGDIVGKQLQSTPAIYAEPVDKTKPYYLMRWGNIYKKVVTEGGLEYEPENHRDEGWVELSLIN